MQINVLPTCTKMMQEMREYSCQYETYPIYQIKSMNIHVFSKDVKLPHQLQRAMAAEAEASREARAKVDTTTFHQHLRF